MPAAKKAPATPAKKADKPVKVPAREAAELVLLDAGRPMHYREITKTALEQGIVRVRGANPRKKPDFDKTMKTIRSFLAGSVTEADSKFVRVDSGVFDLKSRPTKAEAVAARKRKAPAKAKAEGAK
jgi:hypothetical protein